MKFLLFIFCTIILFASCNQSKKEDKVNTTLISDSLSATNAVPLLPAAPQVSEGTDLFGTGNTPPWTLEMDFEKSIHFTATDSTDITADAVRGVESPDRSTTRYTVKKGTDEMIIEFLRNDCVNEMTGERTDFAVSIRIKKAGDTASRTYTGCGRYTSFHGLTGFWVLEGLNNTVFNPADFGGGMPYLELNVQRKKIAGYAGCNGVNGSLSIKEKNISFGKITPSTTISCPNIDLENTFLKHFSGKEVGYDFRAGRLVLQATADSAYIYRRIR
jgi:heat shock protein HslJ/uncharacterized membrane protein